MSIFFVAAHILRPNIVRSSPWLLSTTVSLFWYYNALDGGRRLFRDLLSPFRHESPMHIVLSAGTAIPVIRYQMMRSGGISLSLNEAWQEVADTHQEIENDPAWAILEFIFKNREALENSSYLAMKPFEIGEQDILSSPQLAPLIVPVGVLSNTKRFIKTVKTLAPATILTKSPKKEEPDPDNPEDASDEPADKPEIQIKTPPIAEATYYSRPLICDAVRISLWYFSGWIDWLGSPNQDYNNGMTYEETRYIQNDGAMIVKAILDLAPDLKFISEYFARFAESSRKAFQTQTSSHWKDGFNKFRDEVKTWIRMEYSKSRFHLKNPDDGKAVLKLLDQAWDDVLIKAKNMATFKNISAKK